MRSPDPGSKSRAPSGPHRSAILSKCSVVPIWTTRQNSRACKVWESDSLFKVVQSL